MVAVVVLILVHHLEKQGHAHPVCMRNIVLEYRTLDKTTIQFLGTMDVAEVFAVTKREHHNSS